MLGTVQTEGIAVDAQRAVVPDRRREGHPRRLLRAERLHDGRARRGAPARPTPGRPHVGVASSRRRLRVAPSPQRMALLATASVTDSASVALLRRPWVAALLLLAAYALLSLLIDPRGYLGTDTGAKVATLVVMDARGTVASRRRLLGRGVGPDGQPPPALRHASRVGRWVGQRHDAADARGRPPALRPRRLPAGAPAADARRRGRRTVCSVAGPAARLPDRVAMLPSGWWAWLADARLRPRPLGARPRRRADARCGVLLLVRRLGEHASLARPDRCRCVLRCRGHPPDRGRSSTPWSRWARRVLVRRRPAGDAVDAVGSARSRWRGSQSRGSPTPCSKRALSGQSRTSRATGAASSRADDVGARLEEAVRTTFDLGSSGAGVWLLVGRRCGWPRRPRRAARTPSARSSPSGSPWLLLALYIVRWIDGPSFVPGLLAAFPLAAAGLGRRWRDLSTEARYVLIVARRGPAARVAVPVHRWSRPAVGGTLRAAPRRCCSASTGIVGVLARRTSADHRSPRGLEPARLQPSGWPGSPSGATRSRRASMCWRRGRRTTW